MDLVKLVSSMFVLGVTMQVALTACSGSDGSAAPVSSGPAAVAPTQSAAPAAQPANQSASDLLAQGKLVFEKTAGGVGCAYCHGMDGKGLIGPNIRGKTVENIRFQLANNPQMTFITLRDDEVQAAEAYLKYLLTQP